MDKLQMEEEVDDDDKLHKEEEEVHDNKLQKDEEVTATSCKRRRRRPP